VTAEPVRAFVAIRPPESVLDAIAARTAQLVLPHGRLTTRDQWHVTLQFLGKADVDAVTNALTGIDVGPRDVQLSGVGSLPPERRSKYLVSYLSESSFPPNLWTEAVKGHWPFELRDAVAARLRPLGFEPDERDRGPRRVWPHLTLARMKASVQIAQQVRRKRSTMYSSELVPPFDVIGEKPIGEPWTVDEIVVYESRLRSTGAEYSARARIPLA
jgi:2'-5' RNA ligase